MKQNVAEECVGSYSELIRHIKGALKSINALQPVGKDYTGLEASLNESLSVLKADKKELVAKVINSSHYP